MFPDTQNTIAARLHVRILRGVKAYSFTLARIGIRETIGIAMPVVAVKLNNQIVFGQKSINTKLAANHILRLVDNPDRVEDAITDLLDARSLTALLGGVHLNQHCVSIGVSISTTKRTIGDIVAFPRRRPQKHFAAHLTGIRVLIAALPGDLVLKTAEVMFYPLKPVLRHVKSCAAVFTRHIAPGFAARLGSGLRARLRAKALIGPQMPGVRLTTMCACDRSNFVSKCAFHMPNYSICAAIIKPIILKRWLMNPDTPIKLRSGAKVPDGQLELF